MQNTPMGLGIISTPGKHVSGKSIVVRPQAQHCGQAQLEGAKPSNGHACVPALILGHCMFAAGEVAAQLAGLGACLAMRPGCGGSW